MKVRLIVLSIPFLLTACLNDDENCIRGEGSIVTTTFDVNAFNSISFSSAANITLVRSINYGVDVEAQENIADAFLVNVQNDRLIISFPGCIEGNSIVNITIRTNQLNLIELVGAGRFESDDSWESDELDISLDGAWNVELEDLQYTSFALLARGSSEVELEGQIQQQNMTFEGSNFFDGFELIGHDVSVQIDGAGSAQVNAQQTLNVTINGSGVVAYRGMPTVTSSINGSGSVVDSN